MFYTVTPTGIRATVHSDRADAERIIADLKNWSIEND